MNSDDPTKIDYSPLITSYEKIRNRWFVGYKPTPLTLMTGALLGGFILSSITLDPAPLIISTVLIIIIAIWIGRKYPGPDLVKFAKANGLDYIPELIGRGPVMGTVIDGAGHGHKALDIFSSENSQHGLPPFKMFTFQFEQGPFSKETSYTFAVMVLKSDWQLPHFILDDRDKHQFPKQTFFFSSNPFDVANLERFDLEGNFPDHYTIFFDKGEKLQIDILSILTPDFMHWLTQLDSAYDIEFIDQRIYIFSLYRSLTHVDDFEEIISVAQKLYPAIRKSLRGQYFADDH